MPDLLSETKGALERLPVDITRILGRSWIRISNEQARIIADWPEWSRATRVSQLRDLQNEVARLMGQADELALRFTSRDLPTAYQLGVTATAGALGTTAALSSSDLDVLGEIVTSTYNDLLAATTMVRQSTKDLIRTLTREHLADKLIEGKTAVQTGADLARALDDRGIVAVVYRDGSRHGLDDYAEMLLRTRSAEAYAVAGMQKMATEGIRYVELGDGFGCGLTSHDDPDKANGMILTLEQARAYPTSHPRCVRIQLARPDLVSKRDAANARPSTSAAQDADQAAVSALRAAAAGRRAAAAQRFARTSLGLTTDTPFRAGSVAAMRHARRVAKRAS